MDDLMNFEALYCRELEERDRLRSAANITIGVLALLLGLLGSMLQGAWFEWRALSISFVILASVAALSFLRSLYFVIRCYHGHVYKVMPAPLNCKRHRDALREWHATYKNEQDNADADFVNWLEDAFATASDVNAQINWKRSGCLFRANEAAIYCVVFTLAAAVPYYVHRRTLPPIVQKVEIVSVPSNSNIVKGVSVMADETPKPPPPPKPEPPPLRDLREGQIPKVPKK